MMDTALMPPVNLQAEQALIGMILAAYAVPISALKPDHFADPLHAKIYEAICRRAEAGQPIGLQEMAAELEPTGLLDELGGTAYLTQLVIQAGILSAEAHAHAIVGTWMARQKMMSGGTA
jgi:replicative DNA helicase